MKIVSFFIYSLLVVASYFSPLISYAETVVIVHPSNSVSELSQKVVKKLYLAKSDTFPGGAKATPVDQPEQSAIRDIFYQKVTGKNPSKIKSYWSKMIFSGKASPPAILANDAEVKSWIAANSNGIGYIDKAGVDASVKVVLTVQ